MKEDGKIEIGVGSGLGVLAIGEAIAGIAICPICVVGAPILIGYGIYKTKKK
jgi:hypothetical protein